MIIDHRLVTTGRRAVALCEQFQTGQVDCGGVSVFPAGPFAWTLVLGDDLGANVITSGHT